MSVQELTESALARAEARGGKEGVNCVAEIDPSALKQAAEMDKRVKNGEKLPLGIPILIKDNIDVKGLHTTAGSLALAGNVARSDAPIIHNLRKNGAVILGKTNMTEFANYTSPHMPAGYSSRGGQVLHAADPSLSPSGSSSGSGAAVAAGIVSAAVGTDTSFSIIACAQANGICGLKPPAGTLSPEGIIPIARTLDSAGAMGRTFSDALCLYSAMRDTPLGEVQPAPLAELRLAVNTANAHLLPGGQQDFLRNILASLCKNGIRPDEIEQPPTPLQRTIMQTEFMPHLEDYLRGSSASLKTLRDIVSYYRSHPQAMPFGIGHLEKALEETPDGLQNAAYREALAKRTQMIEIMYRSIGSYDAVIMTGPTNIMHFCGLPSAAVAGTAVDPFGVPYGLIIYGTDEQRLWRAALALEKYIA